MNQNIGWWKEYVLNHVFPRNNISFNTRVPSQGTALRLREYRWDGSFSLSEISEVSLRSQAFLSEISEVYCHIALYSHRRYWVWRSVTCWGSTSDCWWIERWWRCRNGVDGTTRTLCPGTFERWRVFMAVSILNIEGRRITAGLKLVRMPFFL